MCLVGPADQRVEQAPLELQCRGGTVSSGSLEGMRATVPPSSICMLLVYITYTLRRRSRRARER